MTSPAPCVNDHGSMNAREVTCACECLPGAGGLRLPLKENRILQGGDGANWLEKILPAEMSMFTESQRHEIEPGNQVMARTLCFHVSVCTVEQKARDDGLGRLGWHKTLEAEYYTFL